MRHSPHPFLDFCAACGARSLAPRALDCPGEMTAERLAELKTYLAEYGHEVIEQSPGRLWTRTR